eukprot:16452376-Heterocapsa_arctica.AAC.2
MFWNDMRAFPPGILPGFFSGRSTPRTARTSRLAGSTRNRCKCSARTCWQKTRFELVVAFRPLPVDRTSSRMAAWDRSQKSMPRVVLLTQPAMIWEPSAIKCCTEGHRLFSRRLKRHKQCSGFAKKSWALRCLICTSTLGRPM